MRPTNQPAESLLSGVKLPPQTIPGILRQLGPGLIIAGSIVGSGELIATTAVGAEAGFLLLWLILIGCAVKVFTQVEFGRYTILSGQTTMAGLNGVPGPRLLVNWLLWFWLVMFVVSLAQLGGVVGGVGQAMALNNPLTRAGVTSNAYEDCKIQLKVVEGLLNHAAQGRASKKGDPEEGTTGNPTVHEDQRARLMELHGKQDQLLKQLSSMELEFQNQSEDPSGKPPNSYDSQLWALLIVLLTIGMLVLGRYRLIQTVSTAMVAMFTLITIGNLIHLQSLPEWRVSKEELLAGFSFQLPPSGISTALAAFGIIGVGATELIQYPYWCMEKGYAKWTGTRDDSIQWQLRAAGWLRVLRWDAWCSMLVYTFATVAFYLLGAAVLHRSGLNASGSQMIRTLAEMYVPVFGDKAHFIFLIGAVAVLYSTFFVATAGHARVCADAMRLWKLSNNDSKTKQTWIRNFSILFPLLSLLFYVYIPQPKKLILASGLMQSMMLPLLGIAALYFRYFRCDHRLQPGKLWDFCLWLSCAAMLTAGGWGFYANIVK
ncbi:MAG: Nramp family divalent metal transporter [Pirellulales bacterium]